MPVATTAVSDALVAACRRGEENSQLELYNLLSYSLMGVCIRYCPTQAEAEDALQDTFVKIFMRLDQYRNEGPFEAWARRVAVRTCLHAVEQHRLRHPNGVHSAAPGGVDDYSSQLPSPEPSALDAIALNDLLGYLARLPLGYRTVLNLAIEGYSHPEIAQLLHISESTSRSQLARARQLLAQRLRVAEPKLFLS